ncbi:AMP binding protein [Thelephora terrestris]|uniref:AMP binding protein n=1 Tax=Thelephora terrestris TaxID=56493 RepID=A0A9P6L794_9AGAM|nr:AMP binding protein [Thelephora terrestris]
MVIYTSAWPSVPILEESIFSHVFNSKLCTPEQVVYIDGPTGRRFTKANVKHAALSLAHGLRNELHTRIFRGPLLARGDTVMIFSQNNILYPVFVWGIFAAGLRATLAPSTASPTEVQRQWIDSESKVMIVSSSLVHTALDAFKHLDLSPEDALSRIAVYSDDEGVQLPKGFNFTRYEDLSARGLLSKEEPFDGQLSNQTALLCYSSGTSGLPKGVETTHKNLVAQLDMLESIEIPETRFQTMISPVPLYHIYGVVNCLMSPVYQGVPSVIMPRFEITEFLRCIDAYQVARAWAVPPICLALLGHPQLKNYKLSSLKTIISCAAPLPAGVQLMLHKKYNTSGRTVAVTQGYGMTELSPAVLAMSEPEGFEHAGAAGRLLPNLEARLVDDDGRDLPESEESVGELWVRGPTVMNGYLNNASATKDTITADGWLKTGDIVKRDKKGFFTVVDRKKELIKYKGFQVPPAELEGVLLNHPDVADAGVVGVEVDGLELPRAYVVLKKPTKDVAAQRLVAKEIQEWVNPRVGKPKQLRGGVAIILEIPKSPAGKILRRVLKERAAKEVLEASESLRKVAARL